MKHNKIKEEPTCQGFRAASCSHFDFAAAIRSVGLALNSSNGCVTTDDVNAEPDEMSWVIDNTEEIEMLKAIELALVSPSNVIAVVLTEGRCTHQTVKNGFGDTTKSVVSTSFEADNHSHGGGIISDS